MNPIRRIPLNNTVLQKVMSMTSDSNAKKLADKYGLNIVSISWEDNARSKNSCWGPCISDMTLCVDGHRLPIIRSNNFTDLTWDVEMKKIPVIVGNEKGHELKAVSLHEYLENFDKYLHQKVDRKINLLRKNKDSHVIMSSQACFLPIEKEEVNFNVSIFNYQSTSLNPSVLTIVSCASGTSAMIHDGGKKLLHFNKNGELCDYIGQRLSENRKQRGVEDLDKPMTAEEKQQNVLLIIQVPIKKIRPKYYVEGSSMMLLISDLDVEIGVNPSDTVYELKLKIHEIFGTRLEDITITYKGTTLEDNRYLSSYDLQNMDSVTSKKIDVYHKKKIPYYLLNNVSGPHKIRSTKLMMKPQIGPMINAESDVENVIVKVGKSKGKFEEIKDYKFERDERFPVRVTLQYYKATSNGVINEEDIKEIHQQILDSRKYADNIGSLVVDNSDRPTEHVKKPNERNGKSSYKIPIWWDDFWLIHKSKLSRFTKQTAEEFIFENGRFTDMGMKECEDEILTLIKTHPENNLPTWNIF